MHRIHIYVHDGLSYSSFFAFPFTAYKLNLNQRFYEGGFEDKMSRKEASLILGCRESACKEQIMDRYRHLIRNNHPDLGGSPFLAGKVNDAKNMLYERARSDPAYVRDKQRRAEREAKRKAAAEQREQSKNDGSFEK